MLDYISEKTVIKGNTHDPILILNESSASAFESQPRYK